MIQKLLTCPVGIYEVSKVIAPERAADLIAAVKHCIDHALGWDMGFDFTLSEDSTRFKKHSNFTDTKPEDIVS